MGVEGAPVRVEGCADAWGAGLGLGVLSDALAIAGGLREYLVHTVRAHVQGSLVGVEPMAVVPADAVEAQSQGDAQDDDQQQPGGREPQARRRDSQTQRNS